MLRSKIFFDKSSFLWDRLNYIALEPKSKIIWTSGSSVRNYLNEDPLIDWLELYYDKLGFNLDEQIKENTKYLNILLEKGNEFEKKVFDELEKKFGKDMIIVNKRGQTGKTKKNFAKTKEAIYRGVPIIGQAVLFNKNNYTSGCADLLVRSDYINKLTIKSSLTDDEININAPELKQFHYRVIDIKWTTLPFYAKGTNLKNSGSISAYKGQLAIYNCCLGNIQGYFPSTAYLLGKAYERQENGKLIKVCNSFDSLGKVNYDQKDNEYIDKTINAIKWYRDVHLNGSKWNPVFPEIKNQMMFPNMKSDDLKWGIVKKEIVKELQKISYTEPTQIAYVGIDERKLLHENEIYNISDARYTAENMGMKLSKNSEKVDAICEINRNNDMFLFSSFTVTNDTNTEWKNTYPSDMYIDFETINTDFTKEIDVYNTESVILIFMIGVGYKQNDKWNYKSFYLRSTDKNEENRIMDEFLSFIELKKKELDPKNQYKKRLFHWSHAEISSLKQYNERNNGKLNNWLSNTQFVDMYKIFNDKNIVVKGSYSFSLKSIGNALYNLGYIQTKWKNSSVSDGFNALLAANLYYENDKRDKKILDEIINYNEIDCKVLCEIVNFLRK